MKFCGHISGQHWCGDCERTRRLHPNAEYELRKMLHSWESTTEHNPTKRLWNSYRYELHPYCTLSHQLQASFLDQRRSLRRRPLRILADQSILR